jgi:menaquinone-dependent protoporphyrinogen oxidase
MRTKSILLTYATRFGSTQEVAETIAAVLRESNLEVDIRPMQEVKKLDGYDAVVLGAAIYNARWHPEAHQFCRSTRKRWAASWRFSRLAR